MFLGKQYGWLMTILLKEKIKGDSMKKQILKVFTVLSFIATFSVVMSASAQSFNVIRVSIPFDFTLGEKNFPAGKYIVQQLFQNTTNGIMIRSEDGKATVMRLTSSVQSSAPKNDAELIFHRYGNQYFLSEVWAAGENTGFQLPESRGERILERGLGAAHSPGQMQKKSAQPAIVSITASAK